MDSLIRAPRLDKILAAHENKWVALSPKKDRVISSGNTLKEVSRKLTPQERSGASFMRVIPADSGYAPHAI